MSLLQLLVMFSLLMPCANFARSTSLRLAGFPICMQLPERAKLTRNDDKALAFCIPKAGEECKTFHGGTPAKGQTHIEIGLFESFVNETARKDWLEKRKSAVKPTAVQVVTIKNRIEIHELSGAAFSRVRQRGVVTRVFLVHTNTFGAVISIVGQSADLKENRTHNAVMESLLSFQRCK